MSSHVVSVPFTPFPFMLFHFPCHVLFISSHVILSGKSPQILKPYFLLAKPFIGHPGNLKKKQMTSCFCFVFLNFGYTRKNADGDGDIFLRMFWNFDHLIFHFQNFSRFGEKKGQLSFRSGGAGPTEEAYLCRVFTIMRVGILAFLLSKTFKAFRLVRIFQLFKFYISQKFWKILKNKWPLFSLEFWDFWGSGS